MSVRSKPKLRGGAMSWLALGLWVRQRVTLL